MKTVQKKILVISVSAGAGHVSAAKAIVGAAPDTHPDLHIEHIDMMDYVSPAVKHAIVDVYDAMVRTIPRLWGYVYEKTNDEKRVRYLSKLIRKVTRWNAKAFYEYIRDYAPDHIVCTHSFPAQVIRQSHDADIAKLPVSLVVTDYGFHSYWIMPDIAHYFVATEKMIWEMQRQGVSKQCITNAGIPIRPMFFEKKDKQALQAAYNVVDDEFLVLLLAGGQGMMRSDEIAALIQSHSDWDRPIRIFAISGKSERLFNALKKQMEMNTQQVTLEAVSWTNAMDEYMRIADVIISKPGGSTTSECLTLGKQMITIRPIPGQEERNAAHILEQHAGYIARTDDDVLYYLDKEMREQRQTSTKKKKNPATIILDTVLK